MSPDRRFPALPARTPDEAYAPPAWTWRVLTGSLIVYSLALVFFALTPLIPVGPGEVNPITITEWIVAGGGAIGGVGLTLRMLIPRWRIGRWSYLLIGAVGFLTFVAFTVATTGTYWAARLVFILFVWTGVLTAWGAHLEYGGKPSINERGWRG